MSVSIVRALRNACRRLLSMPGHSLLSIMVLGAGLGAVIFLFSLVNALVLRPLPFPDSDRLVAIGHEHEDDVGIGGMDGDEYMLLAGKLHSLEAVGGYEPVGLSLGVGEGATHIVHYSGARLTAGMLDMLGVKPLIGRAFTAQDDRGGAELTVMLGERAWRSDFGGDPAIIGSRVRVDGEWASVIGILPEGFAFPVDSQAWVARRTRIEDRSDIEMVARLRPGTSLAAARAELASVAAAMGDLLRVQQQGQHVVMKPLGYSFVNEKTRSYVWVMFFAGALVLLLACANVANLLLVQTLNRQREVAIRSALGATKWHLLGEQLAESLVLSLLATLLALAFAQLGNYWLEWVYVANGRIPHYFIHLGIDAGVMAFSAGIAVFTTLVSGLLPAWRSTRTNLGQVLRDGGTGSQGGIAKATKALVVAEIVLTVVLLVGAGTFLNGLVRLIGAPVGGSADTGHVLFARVDPFQADYPDAASRERLFDRLGNAMLRQPGVVGATVTNTIPGAVLGSHERVGAQGVARPSDGWTRVQQGIVDLRFADTFGLRVLRGRFFSSIDRADSTPVAVIDQGLAQALWPGRDAVGQHLVLNPDEPRPTVLTVVGVVAPLMLDAPLEDALPSLLRSSAQVPLDNPLVAVRTRMSAGEFAPVLRTAIQAAAPQVPVFGIQSQSVAIAQGRISAVVLVQVFSAVAAIALILAAAGLYGVLAFSVSHRTLEIGIRRAIGATDLVIVRDVGRQLLVLIGIGLGLGIALAIPWSRLLADPGLQTRGNELAVFLPTIGIILGVAILATLAPLWRAIRIDPVVALRYD